MPLKYLPLPAYLLVVLVFAIQSVHGIEPSHQPVEGSSEKKQESKSSIKEAPRANPWNGLYAGTCTLVDPTNKKTEFRVEIKFLNAGKTGGQIEFVKGFEKFPGHMYLDEPQREKKISLMDASKYGNASLENSFKDNFGKMIDQLIEHQWIGQDELNIVHTTYHPSREYPRLVLTVSRMDFEMQNLGKTLKIKIDRDRDVPPGMTEKELTEEIKSGKISKVRAADVMPNDFPVLTCVLAQS